MDDILWRTSRTALTSADALAALADVYLDQHDFDRALYEKTELIRMFDDSINILADSRIAFQTEDTTLARGIFKRD